MIAEANVEKVYGPLPTPPAPGGMYVPVVQVGNLLYLAGQGPDIDGKPAYTGIVGADCSKEDAYKAAQVCGINLLAQLKRYLGDLDKVKRIVNVHVFVASAPDFYEQPKVANGLSELMFNVFGEKGRHSRCALGTSVLPNNIPVEGEMIVEIEG